MNMKTLFAIALSGFLLTPVGLASHQGSDPAADYSGNAGTMSCFAAGGGVSASANTIHAYFGYQQHGHVELTATGTNTHGTLGPACTFDLKVDTANVQWLGANPSGSITGVTDDHPLGCTTLPASDCTDRVTFAWERNVNPGTRGTSATIGFQVGFCLTATTVSVPPTPSAQSCGTFRFVDPPLAEGSIVLGPEGLLLGL